jgi:hypothetical protein
MLGRALLILTLAATTAAAQRDCLVRPNSRGGTSISCSRSSEYARDMRRRASETQREARRAASEAQRDARRIATRVRAESRVAAASARAEARAFERRWNDRPMIRIRERIEPLRIRRPALRYQRW